MVIYDKDGNELIDVVLDDSSAYDSELMGDDSVTLNFALDYYFDFPAGCYIVMQTGTYTMFVSPEVRQNHLTYYEYSLKMESIAGMMKNIILRDVTDNSTSFSLTGTATEHILMITSNLSARYGTNLDYNCIDTTEKAITYDNVTLLDAVQLIADAFETEWWFSESQNMINISKCEHYNDNPLTLQYGKGNGLRGGTIVKSSTDSPLTRVIYPLGSDRNVSLATYGSKTLHMPQGNLPITFGYDGAHFSWELAYDEPTAVLFDIMPDGKTIRIHTEEEYVQAGEKEETLDCTDIYPSRIGEVDDVTVIPHNDDNDEYYFTDSNPSTLPDYSQLIIEGQSLYIVFQSGELAGREFNVQYYQSAFGSAPAKSFKIINIEEDGYKMPSENFMPASGDKYVVFGCALPNQYIRSDGTHTGAEWEMVKRAAAYLYDVSKVKHAISVKVDGIWARNNWDDISDRFVCGSYVLFCDNDMVDEPELLRIVRVKQSLNYPYEPDIELSHEAPRKSLKGRTLILTSSIAATNQANYNFSARIKTRVLNIERSQSAMSTEVSQISSIINNNQSNY